MIGNSVSPVNQRKLYSRRINHISERSYRECPSTNKVIDRLSRARRSWLMSRVKSKNTTPERVVRSLVHSLGFRFRIHRKDIPGDPDPFLPDFVPLFSCTAAFGTVTPTVPRPPCPRLEQSFGRRNFSATSNETKKISDMRNGWGGAFSLSGNARQNNPKNCAKGWINSSTTRRHSAIFQYPIAARTSLRG